MKKILSMLVMCALLLAMVVVSTSAATYYEQGTSAQNTKITVRKSNPVIDGVINPGEYDEYTGGFTEWYVADMAADNFDAAGAMAAGAKWYFAWDGEYIYIAATWNAAGGANQTYPGGDYYDDRVVDYPGAPDDFFGFGPGVNIVSDEVSLNYEGISRFYYAIGENTATGEHITGRYAGQNGQNDDYVPVGGQDFEFTYNNSLVTCEMKLPISVLSEKFVPGSTTAMVKFTVVLLAGCGVYGEVAEDENAAVYSWGVRLGQLGYCCDAGNTAKGQATFRLVSESVSSEGGSEDTTAPDTTAPDTTVGGGEQITGPHITVGGGDDTTAPAGTTANGGATTPNGTTANGGATTPNGTTANGGTTTPNGTTANGGTTTPNGTTANGGATTPNGTTANGGATTPNNGNNGSANRPTTGNGGNASQTADFGVVAALVSAISAAGVMISKKRK